MILRKIEVDDKEEEMHKPLMVYWYQTRTQNITSAARMYSVSTLIKPVLQSLI